MQTYLPLCAFVKDWIYTSQRFLPFTMEFLELVLKVIVYIFLLKSSVKTCETRSMKEKEQGMVGSDQNNKVEHVSLHTVSNTKKMCCYIHLLYTYTDEFWSYWGMSVVICLQWFPCNNSSSSYIMTRTSCIRWEDYVHSIRPTHFFSVNVYSMTCELEI
jgi:hypothetical protein